MYTSARKLFMGLACCALAVMSVGVFYFQGSKPDSYAAGGTCSLDGLACAVDADCAVNTCSVGTCSLNGATCTTCGGESRECISCKK